MRPSHLAAILLSLVTATGTALAAPVTVNFDARLNGGDLTNFTSNFVEVDLDAGAYEVSLVEDLFTALRIWNVTSGCDSAGVCLTGWLANYSIADATGTILLAYDSRANNPDAIRSTPSAALAVAQSDGPQTFRLDVGQPVYVGIFDTELQDNSGGMSLQIAPVTPVPLPATGLLILAAAGTTLALRRRAD